MSEPVRIALIGAGRMGGVHLQALVASETIELAGVIEPVLANRDVAAGSRAPVYESVDEFLVNGEAEGVLIAVPSDQHVATVQRCVAAGLGVLCEKPVGVRSQDAALASAAAERCGVVLQVGYWRRFVPELRRLRERIARGELGEIYQLSCLQWDEELPPPDFRAHSGGIAIDMGVHEFDQIRWLLEQEIDWVTALPGGSPNPAQVSQADPDAAAVLAQLSGGAVATVSLGRRFPRADSCWLEVWGTYGYERLPFMWDADVWGEGSDPVFLGAMVAQAEAFARAVRGAELEGAGGADAVAALKVAERVADSLAVAAERARSPLAPAS